MKKEMVLAGGLLFLLLLSVGCTAPETPPETVPEPLAGEAAGAPPPEPPSVEETTPVEEPSAATGQEAVADERKHNLIFPTLTYEGAYNGPLYGTSEQVGSASMDSYFTLLDKNGINYFIGMFAIEGEPAADTLTSDQGLGEVIAAAQKHPYRIIPFFNPGIGGEEVEQYLGEELTGMYKITLSASQKIVGRGFIRGFGEVETQEWSVRHNDPKVLQLVALAKNNDIGFMFHPVAGKADDVQKIIEAYPDTIFLFHLYREDLANAKDKWIRLLKEHDNLYFSMDAAHIIHINNQDIIYDYEGADRESSVWKLVSTVDSKEKSIITSAIAAYKPLVDAAPDKVMWGTEIGPAYAFDPRVFDRAVKVSRFVIAGFNEEHQELVGYKNALRVFGEGVVADAGINVLDISSWPDCSDAQMSGCDTSCEIPDTEILTTEQDACYQDCLIGKQCREVVEAD